MAGSGMSARRRSAAIAALAVVAVASVVVIFLAVTHPLILVVALASMALMATSVVRLFVTTGALRVRWLVAAAIALVLLVSGIVALAISRPWLLGLLVVALAVAGWLGVYARRGFVRSTAAPDVAGPRRAVHDRRRVLFLNPKSGGGKVDQFDLVAEAARRGVEAVVLGRDDDLVVLAEQAVADGAQVLGMAGGDGSQADVASVCVAHDLPFVCVPAGTRNHFALDLNLDRADPRPALDAFVDAVELHIDHGRAGDRFFVNNVSMGVYPRIVSDPQYRDGRLRTAAELLPKLMTEPGEMDDLRITSPSGRTYSNPQVVLISNNPYRELGDVTGVGRRESLTGGVLGVMVVAVSDPDELAAAARRLTLGSSIEEIDGFDQWTAPSVVLESHHATAAAGVDGEAMDLAVPLDVRIVPGGLTVLVPVGTPATPAPISRLLSVQALGSLLDIAGGVDVGPFGADA